MSDYTPTTEEVRSRYFNGSGRILPAFGEFDAWLAAHDAEKRAEWEAEQEIDDEPCKAEIWSWDIFRHQQVDPYWMRCHRLGKHDEHENSETGARWPVKQEGADQ